MFNLAWNSGLFRQTRLFISPVLCPFSPSPAPHEINNFQLQDQSEKVSTLFHSDSVSHLTRLPVILASRSGFFFQHPSITRHWSFSLSPNVQIQHWMFDRFSSRLCPCGSPRRRGLKPPFFEVEH